MLKPTNILIVENELLIIDILKNAIRSLYHEGSYQIKTSRSGDETLEIINNSVVMELALINIGIPLYRNKKLLYIEDIISKLKVQFPDVKLILFSSSTCSIQIHTLLNTINPESLIIRSDVDYSELVNAIKTVLNASPYYSKTVLQYLRNSIASGIQIDKVDKAILHYLSLGKKTTELPHLVHLSKSAVENRKRKLKDVFGIFKGNDQQLLASARQKGFI
ncbi:hypothetical protein [Winogradskyella sp.]|uniref:hypothetical protein n=1 Tax=Winogradskyella sp. TaxID=1883156 RepID=UPI002634F07C|nr:hypothetical protein [Winogradskyella sp.]